MIPISELIQEQQVLVRQLHHFAFPEAARLIATLSLFPEFAANTIRIEALVQIAAVACQGSQRPNRNDLLKWVNELADS